MTAAGFPHSGISGSTLTCSSPKLIAAYRALLRLSVPRHPPCALLSLDRICSLADGYSARHSGPPNLHTRIGACSSAEPSRSDHSLYPTHYPDCQSIQVRECFRTANARPVRCFLRSRPEGPCASPTRFSRKEVIQPQVPLRLPCYDFAPVIELAFGRSLPCGLGHGLRALPTPMA